MNCDIEVNHNQESDGFALLYAAYGKKIYHLAYRMTGNQEDAEDITQETFLQVYRMAGSFREESRFYTWIYAIAKNLCYRYFQKTKRTSFSSYETMIYEVANKDMPSKLGTIEKEELILQVKEGCLGGLLRCLSYYQRTAFILFAVLQLPIRDVAEILEKSEEATKVLIHRARKNLKDFLCKNCSVYDPGNPCQCENLIDFSLKQGWIERMSTEGRAAPDIKQIEAEIKDLRNVIGLYANIPEPKPSSDLNLQIKELVRNQERIIFTDKKV